MGAVQVQEVRLLLLLPEVQSGSEHGTTPWLHERLKDEEDEGEEERGDVDFPES